MAKEKPKHKHEKGCNTQHNTLNQTNTKKKSETRKQEKKMQYITILILILNKGNK